ncbi:dihydrodipicolinate synthase family protein [Occultella glacieicola]|uniref:Dihydrodipicolinate synthase family protein n=1 Tax=Occultella glacieicola TaxID=2518684 RepID=A0ABY2E9X2_9MICO|nr:dihydrodipicolinate synthase family protein [Occultella glacieicola]TDE95107.1 dihydrodipicolinate synthase family protein [Occultella glacieicola]
MIALDGVTAVLVAAYRSGPTGTAGTAGIDEETVAQIAARVATAGIPVLTALGNTAEVQQLEPAERHAVLRAVANAETPATTLIAGVCGSLGTLVGEIEAAAGLGYHAAMVHEPADPFGDGDGLADLYRQVAQASALPLVLYVRSSRLSAAHLTDLTALPAVVGVKYARTDLHTLARLLDGPAGTQCAWINGLAESAVASFGALGVTSFTSGIANARPDIALAVHRAVTGGDLTALRGLVRDFVGPVEALRAEHGGRYNVATIKALLRWQGIEPGGVRAPHSELSAAALSRLAAVAGAAAPPADGAATNAGPRTPHERGDRP